jgi:hypothetical protein
LEIVKVVEGGEVPVDAFSFEILNAEGNPIGDAVFPVPDAPQDNKGSGEPPSTTGAVTVVIPSQVAQRPVTLIESPINDYIPTYGGDCDSTGRVLVGVSGSASCTVTNTFVPEAAAGTDALLILETTIEGDALISEFTYDIGSQFGGQIADDIQAEPDGPNAQTSTTGTNTIATTSSDGTLSITTSNAPIEYITTIGGDCDTNGLVTIPQGAQATCTITHTFTGEAPDRPRPEAPVARDELVEQRGPDVLIDVLANDSDTDGDLEPSTLAIDTAPACEAAGKCSIAVNPDWTVGVTALDGALSDEFIYEVCDTEPIAATPRRSPYA